MEFTKTEKRAIIQEIAIMAMSKQITFTQAQHVKIVSSLQIDGLKEFDEIQKTKMLSNDEMISEIVNLSGSWEKMVKHNELLHDLGLIMRSSV